MENVGFNLWVCLQRQAGISYLTAITLLLHGCHTPHQQETHAALTSADSPRVAAQAVESSVEPSDIRGSVRSSRGKEIYYLFAGQWSREGQIFAFRNRNRAGPSSHDQWFESIEQAAVVLNTEPLLAFPIVAGDRSGADYVGIDAGGASLRPLTTEEIAYLRDKLDTSIPHDG